jgi:hypothetical protein
VEAGAASGDEPFLQAAKKASVTHTRIPPIILPAFIFPPPYVDILLYITKQFQSRKGGPVEDAGLPFRIIIQHGLFGCINILDNAYLSMRGSAYENRRFTGNRPPGPSYYG